MKRNVLNSPGISELKKRRRRVVLKKILSAVFIFILFFASLVFLSRINGLNISGVQIIGNKVVDAETAKTVVEEQIAGKYFWLFPKTNILLYPKNNIKTELQDQFKRIKDINLSVKNDKTLQVSMTERMALYTWCGIVPNSAEEKCYFMDENGYIFDEAPNFSGGVYFKFYGVPETGFKGNNPLGASFLGQNFKQLISFTDVLTSLKLKPEALYRTDDGDIQIFLSKGKPIAEAPKIILKADADFENVAENLQAALTTEPLQTKFKNNYSKLQYIDLRFGNRVYDKFE